jgi:type II secretory pathway component PulF
MTWLFEKWDVRTEEAGFMLELLDGGCSKEELESILNLRMNDPRIVRRYLGKRFFPIFEQLEKTIGFGASLRIGLQLRLQEDHDKKGYAKMLAYPVFLVFTAYCVLFMFLFAIRPTIENTRSSLGMELGASNDLLQSVFGFSSVIVFAVFGVILYRLRFRQIPMYRWLHDTSPMNPWVIKISRRFSLLYQVLYSHGRSTREIIGFLADLEHQSVLADIAVQMQVELEKGGKPDRSIDELDPFLSRILKIDSHPDFIQKLTQYNLVAQKRSEFIVDKIAYGVTIFAYLSIVLLVLSIYQEIMFPLQILQGMN